MSAWSSYRVSKFWQAELRIAALREKLNDMEGGKKKTDKKNADKKKDDKDAKGKDAKVSSTPSSRNLHELHMFHTVPFLLLSFPMHT